MTMPFSVALQLALVLAWAPALAFADQAFRPAPVMLSAMYESSFANQSLSPVQAQIFTPGKGLSLVIAAAGPFSAKGVVLKIDRVNATVKINHDPVPALDWPGMTMSFRLKERALIHQLKEGDAVEFFFEKSGSDYVIMKFGKPASTKVSP